MYLDINVRRGARGCYEEKERQIPGELSCGASGDLPGGPSVEGLGLGLGGSRGGEEGEGKDEKGLWGDHFDGLVGVVGLLSDLSSECLVMTV